MPNFKTNDDVTLFYEVTGSGQPIVFVHEFGGDYRSWYRQVAVLSKTHRCITYSARGFLPSEVPKDRNQYGQAQSTADLLTLMDHLEIAKAHVVGTSMGSFTSLDFALNHTDRVATLTLVGNSSGPRDAKEQASYRENWVGHEMKLRQIQGGDGAVAGLEGDPAYQSFQRDEPEGWAIYASNLRGQSADGAINVLATLHWNRISLFAIEAQLQALNIPTLLVTGEEDYYLVGETNEFLESVLPNAHRHHFEGTGHLVNIERAEKFNLVLTKHVGRFSIPTGCLASNAF